jgi:hypothetical protein
MILSDEEKKEFAKWLERFSFFTDFAGSNPDITCGIKVYEHNDKLHVRVYYSPRVIIPIDPNLRIEDMTIDGSYDHLKGYGDHGVDACELWGVDTYNKYLIGYVPGEYDYKTWLDVYNDEYKVVVRDSKLNLILGNDKIG